MTHPPPGSAARGPARSPAGAVFVVAAAVLGWLAAAGPGFRDAGELGAAAQTLGVPHPTGFPIDVLLLRAGALLPLGSIALRQNLVVALLSAGALAALAHVVYRLARGAGADAPAAGAGAVVAVCALGGWETFLRSATTVEVYAGALALVGLAAALAFERRALAPLALCLGLSLGAHVSARIAVGAVALAVWVAQPRGERRRRLAPAAVLLVVGALAIAYLPLASLRQPPVDWGDPQTLGRLWEHLSAGRIREAYAGQMMSAGGFADRAAALGAQLGALWPMAPVAAVGAIVAMRHRRAAAITVLAVLALDLSYALLVNPMGIADRQVGHLAGAALCALAGTGAGWLLGAVRRPAFARVLALGLAAVLAAASVLRAPRSVLADGHAGSELLGSGGPLAMAPPRAALVCSEDDVCAQALFALYAERVRPDLRVVPAQHLWEPSVRAAVADRVPALGGLGAARPGRGPARARLARRAVDVLAGQQRAPVLWDRLGPLRRAGVERAAGPSTVPPWLALDPGVGAPPAAGAVAALDALFADRFGVGARRPRAPLAREAWSKAYGSLGRAALAAGRTRAAVDAYRGAVRMAPRRAVAWTNLGVALARGGALDGATEATRRALVLDPTRSTPWVNLVRFSLAQGRPQVARRALETAERMGLGDPRLDELREVVERAAPGPR